MTFAQQSNRSFYTAIPATLKSQVLLNVFTSVGLVGLYRILILLLGLGVGILGIGPADLMDHLLPVRSERQIGNCGIPHRFRQIPRFVAAMLEEFTAVHQFLRTATAHHGKVVRCIHRGGLCFWLFFNSRIRFEIFQIIPCVRAVYNLTAGMLLGFEVRCARCAQHTGKIANGVKAPAVFPHGPVVDEPLPAFDAGFRFVPKFVRIRSVWCFQQPIGVDAVAGIHCERYGNGKAVQKCEQFLSGFWQPCFFMRGPFDVIIREERDQPANVLFLPAAVFPQ